jgi:hypothetical protein
MTDQDPKNIKYALIAVDPLQEGEMKDILHFCGFWEKPGQLEAEHLLNELKKDKEFGLTDIADRLIILPCPDDILQQYLNDIIDN